MARFGTDIGPFAVVPLRLLLSTVSDKAVRLFALLAAKYADKEGRAFPSRRTLSEDLGVSLDTIDRAVSELSALGVLETERRHGKAGDYTSNLYLLRFVLPEATTDGGRTDAATRTPAATVAALPLLGGRTPAATVAAPVPQQEPNPLERDVLNQKEHALAERFEHFWKAYPASHRKGRGAAERAWAKLKPSADLTDTIVAAVRAHLDHDPKWRKDRKGDTFIPHPTTFLNQRRWLDEVGGDEVTQSAPSNAGTVRSAATDDQIDAVLDNPQLVAEITIEVDGVLAQWRKRLGPGAYRAAHDRGMREIAARYVHRLTDQPTASL